ncbi:MAG: glycosyltransferase family 8 protein [Candidatus Nanoarchaeia archaeon]|nr:glycosyltransferase family 8 protein [Candidatus Nanoarchaeia archaeon]
MDTINILVSSNDNFIVFLTVMLKSLFMHHKTKEKIRVFIMDSGISKKNKGLMAESLKEYNADFIFINIAPNLIYDLKQFNVAYYRLIMDKIIPINIKKIIYLDCDLLISKDISKLWKINIGKNIIGAVNDFFIKKIKDGIINFKDFNLDPKKEYFNTGLMLINMNSWRKNKIGDKCIQITLENKVFLKCWDQYSLNIVLYNKWKKINSLWNYNANFFTKKPYIIHYCSPKGKPLDIDYSGYFKSEFFSYLNKTEFKNLKPSINYNVLKRFFIKSAKKILGK